MEIFMYLASFEINKKYLFRELSIYAAKADDVFQDEEKMIIDAHCLEMRIDNKQHSLRALSFASADDLFAIMGLLPGSVTPLGILNDEELQVHFFLDSEFIGNKIGVHPNDNTATVWMQADDLMELIQKHGNEANFTDIQ